MRLLSDAHSDYSNEAGTAFLLYDPPPTPTAAASHAITHRPVEIPAAAPEVTPVVLQPPSGQQTIVSQTPSPGVSLHPDVTSALPSRASEDDDGPGLWLIAVVAAIATAVLAGAGAAAYRLRRR